MLSSRTELPRHRAGLSQSTSDSCHHQTSRQDSNTATSCRRWLTMSTKTQTLHCILLLLTFASTTLAAAMADSNAAPVDKTLGVEKTVEATARSELCSYTLVIQEFDVSRCPANPERQTQADGIVGETPLTYLSPNHAQVKTAPQNEGSAAGRGKRTRDLTDEEEEEGNDGPTTRSLVKDVENKLLEEMVRSRTLNTTLSRHEALLQDARNTLEAYRSNFTSVFRQMMLVERKLHRQRRINRSLNKKLSNVILDVVEVSNVISKKLPVSSGSSRGGGGGKKFAVESSAAIRSCPGISNATNQHEDCSSVYKAGHTTSGVYYIKPLYAACPIPVYCDMESPGGGWLIFQRRRDGKQDFNQNWDAYRHGFGDVSAEHWLGNDNLFLLTNQGRYQLRVDLWDFSGNRVHALYSNFKVDGERDEYRLHVGGYSGSAQDSLHRHNQHKFSTPDRDNDNRAEASCAQEWEAGWWFDNCWFALLNGPYQNRSDVSWRGLAWNHWKREQLRASEMKIRPLPQRRRNN